MNCQLTANLGNISNGVTRDNPIKPNIVEFSRFYSVSGPPWGLVKNPPAMQETLEMQVWSLGQKDLLEEGVASLENPMDRGAWQAIVHGVTRSQTRPKRLSTEAFTQYAHFCPGAKAEVKYQLIPRGHVLWWETQAWSLELSLALETKEDKILVQSLTL